MKVVSLLGEEYSSDIGEMIQGDGCALAVDLSLVIPVYNEMDNVELLHQAICECLGTAKYRFEIIFVDDGSDDDTLLKLKSLVQLDSHVRVLQMRRNFGQTVAMRVGIEHVRGDIIVTLDGDLQNDPRDIPMLISRINEGFDLVVGWRKNRQDRFASRKLPSLVANWCIRRFLGISTHDLGCTLKAYRTELIRRVPLYSDLHRFIPAVCSMASTRIDEVVVRHHPRRYGTTKYGISRTGRVLLDMLTVKMLISCGRKPLLWFGYWAVTIFILAGITGLTSLVFALFLGWTSTYVLPGITIVLGYLGVHLMFSGIFGEIVVRSGQREGVKTLVDVTVIDNDKDYRHDCV
ncbi:MAG: glycosyltransferase family 2 protein [Pirellulales bacterium]